MLEDNEGQEIKTTFKLFQDSLRRAKALIHLQYGITFLLESKGDFLGYFIKTEGQDSPLAYVINTFSEIQKELIMAVDKETQMKLSQKAKEFEEKSSQLTTKNLEESLKPLLNVFEAIDNIYHNPLYHEAVVSSVTSFETYLKDTLINLIIHNKEVEHRFHPELDKGVSYLKIKEYDYDWHDLFGCIVVGEINFFKLIEVDKIFKRAFGIKDSFSIFTENNEKKELQNFLELRHIIVHNGGYVDRKYKNATKCPFEINDFINVEKENLEAMMDIMMKVAIKIESQIQNANYKME